MPTPSNDELYGSHLRVLRIIVLTLIAGVVTFFVIAYVTAPSGQKFRPDPWRPTMPIGVAALGFAAVAIAVSFVLPKLQADAMLRRGGASPAESVATGPYGGKPPEETARLLAIALASTIGGAAVLEGAAFFNIIAFLIEHGALPLATVAVLIALIASRYPTRFGLENWVDERRSSR